MSRSNIGTGSAEAQARPIVVALHCSGGTRYEWSRLEQNLGPRYSVIAPDLIGCGATGPWTGERAFTLSDEAAPIVKLIDAANSPVHLVGHSYGGCVALRIACQRPSRIASLSLYEPAVLHVLKTAGRDGKIALAGLTTVARDVTRYVLNGAYQAAARRFVECWSGVGSWSALRRDVRDDLARYIPKACFEFNAEVNDRTPLAAYARFGFPVLLMQGEHSSEPMQLIARQLARAMKLACRRTVYGAGHMGPFTHAAVVNRLIVDHITTASPDAAAERDASAHASAAA